MPSVENQVLRLAVPARLECVGVLGVAMRSAVCYLGWDKQHADALELAVVEAANNAIEHGRASAESDIELQLSAQAERLCCELTDYGAPMPKTVVQRLCQGQASMPEARSQSESGYGLALMQNLVDEVSYHSREDANMLRLVKYR